MNHSRKRRLGLILLFGLFAALFPAASFTSSGIESVSSESAKAGFFPFSGWEAWEFFPVILIIKPFDAQAAQPECTATEPRGKPGILWQP